MQVTPRGVNLTLLPCVCDPAMEGILGSLYLMLIMGWDRFQPVTLIMTGVGSALGGTLFCNCR